MGKKTVRRDKLSYWGVVSGKYYSAGELVIDFENSFVEACVLQRLRKPEFPTTFFTALASMAKPQEDNSMF